MDPIFPKESNHRRRDQGRLVERLVQWVVGFCALLWLVMRSGRSPKRLMYPCQQAAMPLVAMWLTSMLALWVGSVVLRRVLKFGILTVIVFGLAWYVVTFPITTSAHGNKDGRTPSWSVASPISTVYVLNEITPTSGSLAPGDGSVPDAYMCDPAIDTLLGMMEEHGEYVYSTVAHPEGIIHANDVVIIKGNYQWTERNTTNTDRVKGMIWKVLNHPEGFTGEVLVCDNTQTVGGIDEGDNNSDDSTQSIVDVVNVFRAKGYPVGLMNWSSIWDIVVNEYSLADYRDGYVYESATKISYPKFRTPVGHKYVSTRFGVWDSLEMRYDSTRLCLINFPVLKAHGMSGATIGIKNWIGLMTIAYNGERFGGWSAMHSNYLFNSYALVARIMAETFPKLTIVDATWTTKEGPSNPTAVVKTRKMLASRDPVAVSWYSAKYILTPVAHYPEQTNPDVSWGQYHNVLTNWSRYLRDSAGLACTMDSSEMTIISKTASLQIPQTPVLVSPPDSALQQPTGIVFRWYRSQNAFNFHFQLSTDSAFTSIVVNDTSLADTIRLVAGMSKNSTYYWRVSVFNVIGASAFSDAWSFTTGSSTTVVTMTQDGWNLMSLPLQVSDASASVLFPASVSSAYSYIPDFGYQSSDSLMIGSGYWIKFSGNQIATLSGQDVPVDSFDVKSGWNLIGSISSPVKTSMIGSDPPGIITTDFFGYSGMYTTIDTIYSGKGYWVKVNQDGKLILSVAPSPISSSRIRIVPTSELPPYPPSERLSSPDVPKDFALQQPYPNPFNPSTNVRFEIPSRSQVKLEIFDVLGRKITTLVDETKEAGRFIVRWNADVSSGIYFCRFEAKSISDSKRSFVAVRKMLFLR